MSSYCRRISRQKEKAHQMGKRVKVYKPAPKLYKSFNIFTRDGENRVVTTDRPMTIEEAQYHFKALSISGNE